MGVLQWQEQRPLCVKNMLCNCVKARSSECVLPSLAKQSAGAARAVEQGDPRGKCAGRALAVQASG